MAGKKGARQPVNKGQRTLEEINAEPPGKRSMLHPEGWQQMPDAEIGYAFEQRVWAVCYLNPELTDKTGRLTRKIQNLMVHGDEFTSSSVGKALASLEKRGVLRRQMNSRRTFGVFMVDTENAPHSWAVRELRDQIERRRRAAKAKPEVVVMPKDYEATPEHLRTVKPDSANPEAAKTKVVVVNPPPAEPAVLLDSNMDLGALADQLLISVMQKLNAPAKVVEVPVIKDEPALKKRFEEARRYAFLLEGKVKAHEAQIKQMEQNLTAAVDAAKDLQARLDTAEQRVRRADSDDKRRDRNTRLRDAISPQSRAALDAAKAQDIQEGR